MTEWLLTDLHIHTTLSDGALPIEEVVKIYGERGFDAIAITDHLFDTQSQRGLELYDEGKSIKDLGLSDEKQFTEGGFQTMMGKRMNSLLLKLRYLKLLAEINVLLRLNAIRRDQDFGRAVL